MPEDHLIATESLHLFGHKDATRLLSNLKHFATNYAVKVTKVEDRDDWAFKLYLESDPEFASCPLLTDYIDELEFVLSV